MQEKLTCPLGSDCERAVNGVIERCAWYVKIQGKHPQSEELIDDWRCAMAWQPLLLIENAQMNRGQTAAIESLRNEMKSGQDQFNGLMKMRLASETKEVPPCNTV